jgi:hypothetical protein
MPRFAHDSTLPLQFAALCLDPLTFSNDSKRFHASGAVLVPHLEGMDAAGPCPASLDATAATSLGHMPYESTRIQLHYADRRVEAPCPSQKGKQLKGQDKPI